LTETQPNPPYTIDPQVHGRFDQRKTVFGRRMWDQRGGFYRQDIHGRVPEIVARGEPGYSRVEYARLRAAWTIADHFEGAYSWQKLGQAEPILERLGQHPVTDRAEMSATIKDTARMYGASLVGIAPLDRRWVYSHNMGGHRIDIPPAFGWAIVMAIAMDAPAIESSPAYLAGSATGVGYSRMAFSIACLAEFIRNLGYQAISMGNDTALSIPLAIDAGLGELGRNGLLVTPEYRPCVRLCKVFTDLPLAPDRPGTFGVTETCKKCLRCAEACEVEAISSDPTPSYRTVSPSNNRGIKRWAVNHDKCYTFWVENGASCSTCIAVCPFTQHAPTDLQTKEGG
jgi:epoxyqueuosine reductase